MYFGFCLDHMLASSRIYRSVLLLTFPLRVCCTDQLKYTKNPIYLKYHRSIAKFEEAVTGVGIKTYFGENMNTNKTVYDLFIFYFILLFLFFYVSFFVNCNLLYKESGGGELSSIEN